MRLEAQAVSSLRDSLQSAGGPSPARSRPKSIGSGDTAVEQRPETPSRSSSKAYSSPSCSFRECVELEPSEEQRAKESHVRDSEGPRRKTVEGVSLSGISSATTSVGSPVPPGVAIMGTSSSSSYGSGRVKSEAKQILSRHTSSQARMWDECRLLRRLRHPNVVCVQDVVDIQLSRPLKGSSGPNLRRTISRAGGRLSLQQAQVIFVQLCAGLAYIHDQRIAHRNLKPEAIMVSDADQVKVSNFSLAVKICQCRDKCGTMPFVAPEVLAGKPYDPSCADVWSAGVVLTEMLCGINKVPRMLQWGNTSSRSSERAYDLEEFFRKPDSLLLSCQADLGRLVNGLDLLLAGLLTVAPEERWSAAQSRDAHWTSMGALQSSKNQDQCRFHSSG
eukprot:CAMPEP_0177537258 /NCGR_PEP_ID=MMETSP0369-20130122/57676_1 /TAXON_ID=447022 ORGANISM="Scrippsiella hangoei-like, Strain SHHI-4" /NCGR_SAMPLE_ID=MMETSP0369 /ASSEMBLY_ACC=CAM_ASM_000364 /LENGTH=388 /DNA_ID=CAMNT_0019019847 /DNA_START=27 /DNA_END=1189 /DNA_ORIENTATION=+